MRGTPIQSSHAAPFLQPVNRNCRNCIVQVRSRRDDGRRKRRPMLTAGAGCRPSIRLNPRLRPFRNDESALPMFARLIMMKMRKESKRCRSCRPGRRGRRENANPALPLASRGPAQSDRICPARSVPARHNHGQPRHAKSADTGFAPDTEDAAVSSRRSVTALHAPTKP